MKLSDFKLFKKLMMTTMSGADAEVLFAIRRANQMLVAEKSDWDRVLDMKVTLEVEDGAQYSAARPRDRGPARPAPPSDEMAAQIDRAFDVLWAAEPKGSWREFVSDVHRDWKRRGWLTDNQRTAILEAARKERERG